MGKIIQIENGKTTVYVSGEDIGNLPPIIDTYYVGVDNTSGAYEKLNPNGTLINLEAGSVSTTTYADIVSLMSSSGLTPGTYYNISDFETVYDQPDYFVNGDAKTIVTTNTEINEPLIVLAISTTELATEAFQPNKPKSKIKYDVTFSSTEVMGNPAKGRISELIDDYNNRTDYDHVNVKFKRYQDYGNNFTFAGTITDYDCTTGLVVGNGTSFTSLTPGDILVFNTKSDFGYNIGVKVAIVSDNNNMYTYVDANYSSDVFTSAAYSFYSVSPLSTYTSYKEIYISQSDNSDYNEFTLLSDTISNSNYIGDFAKFGMSFILSNNIIGTSSSLNVFGDATYNNTIGSYCQNNKIDGSFYENNIGSNFVNNKINLEFKNNVISDYFGYNNIGSNFIGNICYDNFKSNQIGNFCGNNVKSNIFGEGTKNNIIGDYFGSTTTVADGGNTIGMTTNIDYTIVSATVFVADITTPGTGYSDSTGVTTSTITGSGSGLIVDITTDGFGLVNSVTVNTPGIYYSIGDTVTVSAGGNDCVLTIIKILSNSVLNDVIINGSYGSAEVLTDDGTGTLSVQMVLGDLAIGNDVDNSLGSIVTIHNIYYSVIADGGMKRNVIGNFCLNNLIGVDFNDNKIGNYFGNDKSDIFSESNIILDNFSSNNIANYFGQYNYTLGSGGNLIRTNFTQNTVGDNFTFNQLYDTFGGGFSNNVIGYGCDGNIIYEGFNYNRIGDLFNSNLLNTYFSGNDIGYFFNNNQIDSNATNNKIGSIAWFNLIGTDFTNNEIGNTFFGNENYDFFSSSFIPFNDFHDNKIGNNFGKFFVTGNTVGDSFQYVTTQYDVFGVDFISNPATHVYNGYSCTIFANETQTLRLSYFDSLDFLKVVNPDV